MATTGDLAVRNAAGIIMWHIKKGHSESESRARAWKREPALTEREIGYALEWARAGLAFQDVCGLVCQRVEIRQREDGTPYPYFGEKGPPLHTIGKLLDAAGLTPFIKDQQDA